MRPGSRVVSSGSSHGLPLIIHSLWIAAMSCGVREEALMLLAKLGVKAE
jgi:hypothetical protein